MPVESKLRVLPFPSLGTHLQSCAAMGKPSSVPAAGPAADLQRRVTGDGQGPASTDRTLRGFQSVGFSNREARREHEGSAPARGAQAERHSEDRILTYTVLREQLFW